MGSLPAELSRGPSRAGRRWGSVPKDLGIDEDVRRADLAALLAPGAPSPTQVTALHVQSLRFDLRAETLSHAAGLTAHTASSSLAPPSSSAATSLATAEPLLACTQRNVGA